jgi:ATPase subunit of ABC transporter with duplicated ATPase domains
MVSTATTLAPAAGTLLRVAGVSKRFGGVTALADVDLEVHPGEIVSLIGPNGACRVALWMENSAGTERYCHYYGPTHAERSSHHAFVRSSHRWHAESVSRRSDWHIDKNRLLRAFIARLHTADHRQF